MTTPSEKTGNTSFSSFGIGVLFGVAAAFLFGTEEGRKIVKKIAESVPEKYKNPLNLSPLQPAHSSPSTMPIIQPEETQHHATYEAPPPPAPHVRPTRPEPFTPSR
ncbi:MAG: hypothetical protein UW68_C0015G0033 [Candidatus Collierbacteria bacterium GW2011_GWB1_44_6]|uniref:Uncharacterized protein n=1 Tax=Candidatus Collierbacteria bacterium GW2011_GWB1_44_6 TaxID=1618384 RepID=A0A0G1JPB9_9BACT|nr:MAG: hypothetical protein UW68_C0015G0033 [Candidatus Collierbacteria bacterium GW2011_GWB1_44_6]